MQTTPTIFPQVKPYPGTPLLNPTLVIEPKPGDMETPYALAHRLLDELCQALDALQATHQNVEAVGDLAATAFLLFEDTVREQDHEPLGFIYDDSEARAREAYYARKYGDEA